MQNKKHVKRLFASRAVYALISVFRRAAAGFSRPRGLQKITSVQASRRHIRMSLFASCRIRLKTTTYMTTTNIMNAVVAALV